jgi:hypothetical protein
MIRPTQLLGLLLLAACCAAGQAQQHPGSRIYFNQDIFVAHGQQIHNATCLFCSVQVEGDLTGNVLVLFGNLNVTGRVEHRATVIGGNAVLDSEASIGGNALVLGGNAVYETDDSIGGNAWVVGGHLSPSRGHARTSHHFFLSPMASSAIAIAVFLLCSLLLIPRRRTDAA